MKFKLSNIFALLHFGFFLGVFSLFIYWQFTTIKEFHKIELGNFFDQTNNVANVIFEKQQKEIIDLIQTNLNEYSNTNEKNLPILENIDFVFYAEDKKVLNIDGFSLLVDINLLAKNLAKFPSLSKITKVQVASKNYYLLIHKEKVIDAKLGRVKGEVFGAIFLNNNQIFLEDIRKNLKLKELVFIDKNQEIISSSLKHEKLKNNFDLNIKNSQIQISKDKEYIYRKDSFDENLDVIYMIDNNHYNNIYEKFMLKVWWVAGIFIFLGLVIYFLVKYSFIKKIDELKLFIEDSFANKKAKYKNSNIKELDDLSVVFEELFIKFNQNKSFQEILIQTLPIPFFSKDKNLKYNEFNDAFLNMLGKKREEILNKGVFEISPEDLAQKYHEADLSLIKDKKQIYEAKVLFSDEKKHDVIFFKASIFDDKGDFAGILGVVVDVTENKTMQKELEELNKSLELQVQEQTKELTLINSELEKRVDLEVEKNRKKDIQLFENAKNAQMGEMIGNIAHQWRQPLSVISTIVSGMSLAKEFGTLKDDDFKKKSEMVMRNIKYLSNTIDTFRDYIKEENILVDAILQERIGSALSIIEASLQNNHIELIKDIPTKSIPYRLVQGELSQVIINLINNAKDALCSNEDVLKKWVKIGLLEENDKVIIYVEDNAGGVPQAIIEKIFNPYFTTKHQSQGTGLGLHMSKDIIAKHFDGKLYVKNTEFGAKFVIELPAQK